VIRLGGAFALLAALCAPAPSASAETDATEPVRGKVIWSADHETGNSDQWEANSSKGVITRSESSDAVISSDYARSGQHAMKLTIDTSSYNANHGVWLNRLAEMADGGARFYSAYYYIPQAFAAPVWWNVMQFQSETTDQGWVTPWSLHISNRSNGNLYFWLLQRTYLVSGKTTGKDVYHKTPLKTMDVPVGKWFKLEMYLKQATPNQNNGEIIVWQDGVMLYRVQNIATRGVNSTRNLWSANHYSNKVLPAPASIYIDDAEIRNAAGSAATPGNKRLFLPLVNMRS
jgi:hypothetical protein